MLDRIESMSPRARTAGLFTITAVAVFALIAWRAELRFQPLDPGIDGFYYTRLAHGYPGEIMLSPFRNRMFTPGLVAILPIEVTWGFALVNAVAVGVTVAVMDRLLRLWFSVRYVWFGLGLLVTAPLLFNAANPFGPDSVLVAFSAAILLCLATNRWVPLLILFPLAVTNHELVLVLLIPVVLTGWRQKRLPDTVLIGGLSIGVWWVMHRTGWIVEVNNRGNILDAGYREEMVRWNARKHGTVMGSVWTHFIGSIGILGVLAPFGWRRAPQLARDASWVLVPCAVGIFTASDWGRLFLPALPVLVVLGVSAATGLRDDVIDLRSAEDHSETAAPTPHDRQRDVVEDPA